MGRFYLLLFLLGALSLGCTKPVVVVLVNTSLESLQVSVDGGQSHLSLAPGQVEKYEREPPLRAGQNFEVVATTRTGRRIALPVDSRYRQAHTYENVLVVAIGGGNVKPTQHPESASQ
jgi:hypothetical protein